MGLRKRSTVHAGYEGLRQADLAPEEIRELHARLGKPPAQSPAFLREWYDYCRLTLEGLEAGGDEELFHWAQRALAALDRLVARRNIAAESAIDFAQELFLAYLQGQRYIPTGAQLLAQVLKAGRTR